MWWSLVIIAMLAAFNIYLADNMIRMRADMRMTRITAKKILARLAADDVSRALGPDKEQVETTS